MTTKLTPIRYEWSRVTPETLQELAQVAHDCVNCIDQHRTALSSLDALGKVVQKARWQAVVMEIDQAKINVLAEAEQYYNACTGSYLVGKESETLNKLKLAIHRAFGSKP